MYKNQKAEIATFISIATLIGIAVFTLITAKVNTNISQKQTTNTKAAELCDGSVSKTCNNYYYNYDYDKGQCCGQVYEYPAANEDGFPIDCSAFPGYSLNGDYCVSPLQCDNDYVSSCDGEYGYTLNSSGQCCRTVEDPAPAPAQDPVPVDPGSSSNNYGENTCVSGYCIDSASCSDRDMDNVSGESCGINNWSCCKEKVLAPAPEDDCRGGYCVQGDCEGSEMDTNNGTCGIAGYFCCKEKAVQPDFTCESTDLSCDTSGNTCNGNIEGYCHQSSWGVCCRSSSTETPQDQTTSAKCEDVGGECLYDGLGSPIDLNLYERVEGGECNWIYACYKQKLQQVVESDLSAGSGQDLLPSSEEIPSTPEGQDAISSFEASSESTLELRKGVVKINGIETTHYSDENIIFDVTYASDSYTEGNPEEIIIQKNGAETYILRDDDIDYEISSKNVLENLTTGEEAKSFEVTD
jgi:hypothetical protein